MGQAVGIASSRTTLRRKEKYCKLSTRGFSYFYERGQLNSVKTPHAMQIEQKGEDINSNGSIPTKSIQSITAQAHYLFSLFNYTNVRKISDDLTCVNRALQ